MDEKSSLRRGAKERVSSTLDKWFFIMVFVAGAAGIVVLKWLGYSQVYVTAWPFSLMILYFLSVLIFKRFQIREDIAGDNLYYLGFLFTLTSLALALFQFASSQDRTELIITNFGIALATTILGLFFRVLLHQMRQDPVEIEREARLTLAEAVSNLKSELYNALLEFNAFRRALQQSFNEGVTEYSKLANENLEQTVKRSAEVAQNVIGIIEEAFESFSQNASQFKKISGQTTKAMEKLIDRIEGIEVPTDLISEKFKPTFEAISEAATIIRNRATAEEQQTQRLIKLTQAAIESANLLDSRIAEIGGKAASFEQMLERLGNLGGHLAKFQLALEGAAGSMKKLHESQEASMVGLIEAARKRVDELTARFDTLVVRQDEAFGKLRDLSESYARETLALARSVADKEVEKLSSLSALAHETLENVRKHNRELEEELNRSRVATGKVLASLASMSNLLVEQLGGSSTVLPGSGRPVSPK